MVSSSQHHVPCQALVGVAAGDDVHAQSVDGAGDNKADMGLGRTRGREEKAGGGSVFPPPTK